MLLVVGIGFGTDDLVLALPFLHGVHDQAGLKQIPLQHKAILKDLPALLFERSRKGETSFGIQPDRIVSNKGNHRAFTGLSVKIVLFHHFVPF